MEMQVERIDEKMLWEIGLPLFLFISFVWQFYLQTDRS